MKVMCMREVKYVKIKMERIILEQARNFSIRVKDKKGMQEVKDKVKNHLKLYYVNNNKLIYKH